MALGTISPVGIQQFMDANGNPLAGGTLGFYLAGTTTLSPAYADVNLTVPLANPVVLDAAGRAPELFLGALTYKQVLKNAGGVTIWTADDIITPAALRSVGTSTTVTGPQHDFPIPQGLISYLDFRNTAAVTIDGFAGGTPGQLLLVRALGTANVNLVPFGTSTSATPNKLYNFVNSGVTTLVPNSGTATYLYQNGWVLLNHEQGSWIRVPYSAGNFTVASGTWVVDPADDAQMDYRLSGTSLLITISLGSTTITGTPSELVIGGWPYTLRTPLFATPGLSSQSAGTPGQWGGAVFYANASEATVRVVQANFANWAAGANNVNVYGQFYVDVN